jgi:hypothetical protein
LRGDGERLTAAHHAELIADARIPRRYSTPMVTPLRSPLRREIRLRGAPWIVTIAPDGLKLVEKGRRRGQELKWHDLVSGEAAMAVALNASMAAAPAPRSASRESRASHGTPRSRRSTSAPRRSRSRAVHSTRHPASRRRTSRAR